MKVFLSWSGERSRIVATALRKWLPDVVQAVEPWMSKHDIGAGSRWSKDIGQVLNDADFGILCLTSENYAAPWLLFEAGALAKRRDEARVVPYLIGIEPSDLPAGPLNQFQAKRATVDDTWDLVQAINA